MATWAFKSQATAEALRDMIEGANKKATRLPNSVPVEQANEANTIFGFHATSGIPASTVNTSTPTSSSYKSALCSVYRLDSVSTDHVPIAVTDGSGATIQVYVINPTSTAIASNQMVWGARPAGTREGLPVFMALVEDCP